MKRSIAPSFLILILAILFGIFYGLLVSINAPPLITWIIGIIGVGMALLYWPIFVLGTHLRIVNEYSLEEAKKGLKNYFIIFIEGIGFIIVGIVLTFLVNQILGFVFFYIGLICILDYFLSVYLKKLTNERIFTYDRMYNLLMDVLDVDKNIIETYIEKSLTDYGHKMFKVMSKEELVEDFKIYQEIVLKNKK